MSNWQSLSPFQSSELSEEQYADFRAKKLRSLKRGCKSSGKTLAERRNRQRFAKRVLRQHNKIWKKMNNGEPAPQPVQPAE